MERSRIEKILVKLGVPMHLKGFSNLVRLIELCLEEPKVGITKLINVVANENNDTYIATERSIKFAIMRFGNNRDLICDKNLTEFFKGKMTTKCFVKTVIYCLEHNLDKSKKAVCVKL